jgi:hypothetical protein
MKPMGGAAPPPKPPGLGARPTVPLKPAPAPIGGASSGGAPAADLITQKASPKKETARITLPPEGSKPGLPKATVKMQQTQPLANRPAAALTPAPISVASGGSAGDAESDSVINGMAIAALVLALAALATVYLAFSAASSAS